MDALRRLVVLAHLRRSAARLEQDAQDAQRRGRPGESLVLLGASEGIRFALRAVEDASSPTGQDEPHLELIAGGRL